MSAYALLQGSVIAIAILASAWTALGALAPQWRAHLLQRFGRHPAAAPAKPACDSGCSTCDGCASTARPPAREQPIRFHAPR